MTEPLGVRSIGELPAVGPAALCMGVFDGVHRGHRALTELTRHAAAERGLASVALLFEPPPVEVMRPGHRLARLATPEENLRRLAGAGVDVPIGLHFDEAVRMLPPDAFLAALAPPIELRVLVMTSDSAFGYRRAGTAASIAAHAREAGFELLLLDPLVEAAGGVVSSSRARQLIAQGDLAGAEALVGAPAYLAGTVDGDGVLALDYVAALPPSGMYVAQRRGGGEVRLRVDGAAVRVAGAPPGSAELDLLGPA